MEMAARSVVAGQYQWEVVDERGRGGRSLGGGGSSMRVTGGQSQVLAKSGEY